jgi:hypothetical protein
MPKLSQAGIAISVLGGVITLIGLFPGIIGSDQTSGTGILQILVILVGMIILIAGAYIFAQSAFFPGQKHNLAQQIALRLSMTGLVIASASGLADILGFGSHPIGLDDQRPLLGWWQTSGLIGGFLIASIGVLIFVLMGHPHSPDATGNNVDDDINQNPL